ncbi:glycosyltransferase family 4 protein [Vibrio sp. S4M6]|uniref:glycosyltransferase family 4 protein n=1 Tax=Vibrio sinus TaxID=2946865 RepID=UPI00202A7680|nr:glycosyltransferase family 1 protein [Vibrio sinus]MCL9781305.1 glycosyltransferase family 4 protein [Vibrio sinus]
MILVDERWSGFGGIGRFADEISARFSSSTAVNSACSPASLFNPIALALALAKQKKEDVAFLPGYIPPIYSSVPYVFTVHDLNHLDRPENASFLKSLFYRFFIKPGCHRAAAVLTVSEFSRQRIIEWSGVAADKVINVGNGVDDAYSPNVEPYSPGHPYLLCVGNRKPHKNEPMLIRAFAQAQIDSNIRLLFTGNATEELEALISSLGLESRVSFYGFVEEEQLPSLYKGALALVFPSLYEGFGLPVIESMACGTPVITSNCTSLPEVAGDAALLVDPNSKISISSAIEKLVSDEELQESLALRGLDQAKKFTWDLTAQLVESVLLDAAKNKV